MSSGRGVAARPATWLRARAGSLPVKAATIARGQLRIGLLVAGLALAGPRTGAASPMLVALSGDGMLITFSAEHPGDARTTPPSGVSGQLIGLDRRPANGLLYCLTAAGDVYTIDPVTAAGSLVSTLTVPFNGGRRSALDRNPRTDRPTLGGP